MPHFLDTQLRNEENLISIIYAPILYLMVICEMELYEPLPK